MFNRTNCDRKSHLSGILTEPLKPRECVARISIQFAGTLTLTFNNLKRIIFIPENMYLT